VRRVATLLTALVCVGVSAVASPAAAVGAGPGVGRCLPGNLCVWTQPGFRGVMTVFSAAQDWPGRCRATRSPIRSVANLTAAAPWRLHLSLFHSPTSRPCDRHGLYAQYAPFRVEGDVRGGPVTGLRIYAEPNQERLPP
jgi:hypothetical protein